MNGGPLGGDGGGGATRRCANGHPLEVGAASCATCGAPAAAQCTGGHPLAPGEQHCAYCGAPAAPSLGASTRAPAANRTTTWLVVAGIAAVLLLAGGAALVLRRDTTPVATTTATASTASTTAGAPTASSATTTGSGSKASDPDRTATSSPGGRAPVDPEGLKAELRAQGMDAAVAECIVEGLVLRGVPLESFSGTPSSADRALLTQLAKTCALLGPSATTVPPQTGPAAPEDYDLLSRDITCAVDDVTGAMMASGTLTNRKATTQAYQVKVDFLDERNAKLGSATGFTGDLAPNQKGTWDMLSFDSSAIDKKVTCRVVAVEYSLFSTK